MEHLRLVEAWATIRALDPSPANIRATGIALLLMGYSCRRVERELRALFLYSKVPSYPTISRWVRRRPTNRIALVRWWKVCARAAEIVEARIDYLETLPIDQLMRVYSRITDVCRALESAPRR